MYLLDTNVLSEMRRRERADPKVVAWATAVAPSDLFLSAITILEIELGALLIGRRDEHQGAVLRGWIDNRVLPAFSGRILPVDTQLARLCARLHVPDRWLERDALIGATELAHRLKLVTRNSKDFASMGLELVNPWT